jgi:hypothetical protein
MPIRLVASLLLVTVTATPCFAYSTNFEDLVPLTQYAIGSSFASGDIGFKVVSFPASYPLRVAANNYAGGGGKELWMGSGVGVEVSLPPGVSQVAFKFGQYHPQNGLRVNGVSLPFNTTIRDSNGLVLGGVNVAVANTPSKFYGVVTLSGPVQSLALGGVEFAVDDIAITAPAIQPDFDGDSDVHGADFLTWQRTLGATNPPAGSGDADADHDVDGTDLAAWRFRFGGSAQTVTAIPEPSAISVAMIATFLGCLGRERKR